MRMRFLTTSLFLPLARSYNIKFVQAQVDDIDVLSEQKNKSKPLFLFYKNGAEVDRIPGANALELERKVKKLASKKD